MTNQSEFCCAWKHSWSGFLAGFFVRGGGAKDYLNIIGGSVLH